MIYILSPSLWMRRPLRAVLATAVFAFVGGFGSATLAQSKADEPETRGRARRVRVERLTRSHFRRTTTQTGSLQAFESADLYARVSGYLKKQIVDIGGRVKRGELLAEIDAPEVLIEAERTAAVVEQARAMVALGSTRIGAARGEMESAEAAVAQAEAEVKRTAATRSYREKELTRYKDLKTRRRCRRRSWSRSKSA
jgi:HlyD family secretion protein